MKKIKKQRLSLKATVVRNLDDQQLSTIAAAGCLDVTYYRPPHTALPCYRCTTANSGCYNPN